MNGGTINIFTTTPPLIILFPGPQGPAGEAGFVSASNSSYGLGTLVFSNSNGLAFGISSNTLTASYTQQAQSSLVYSNSNNVSFTTNGSTLVASASYPAQTQFVLSNSNGLTFGTNGSTVTGSVSSLVFSNSNGVSFGINQGTLTASVQTNYLTSQSGQAFSASGGSSTFQTLSFANSNGFTFSNSNGSIIASYTVPGGGSPNISAGTTSNNLGSIVFSNSNNVSFGLNGSTITATATFAQSNQNLSLFGLGNTTQNSSTVLNASVLSLNAIGSLTVGYSNGSIQLSAPNALTTAMLSNAVTLSNINISAGTTSNLLSKITFSNSNGISFGLNASTITASVATSLTAINVSGGTTSNNLSALTFSNSNGVSFGLNGSVLTASVAAGGAAGSISAGTTSVALGQAVFSNSNNVSFGLNGSTVTASAQINLSAGTTSGNLSAFTLSNSNGISFGLNASTITAQHEASFYALGNTTQNSSSHINASAFSLNAIGSLTIGYSNGSIQLSAPNALTTQSNQNISLFALGNTTQNSSTVLNASNLSFNGLGNITVGFSNGSIQISQTGGGGGAVNFSAGTTSNNLNSITFSNSNGVSFGLNGSTMTASIATSLTAINFSAGTTSNNLSALTFSNSNGVSFGLNGSTVTAQYEASWYALGNTTQNSSSHINGSAFSLNGLGIITAGYSNGSIQLSATTSQSNQVITFFGTNNTTQNTSGTANASSLLINGLGNVSVGYSNGSVVISGGTAAASPVNFSAGTTSGNLGSVVFSNSNGLSFGLNGSTITATVAANMSLYALGNTTQNSSTVLNMSNLSFNALGAATWGYSNGSIDVSVPATSSISATGGLSLSVNGSTISMGVPSPQTLSFWSPFQAFSAMTQNTAQGSLSVQQVNAPFNVTGSAMMFGMSISGGTSTSATTASANNSIWVGIYTQNGSTLSLASSGSQTYNFAWSQSASTTGNTSINSMRQMTVPINFNITPGQYWVALVLSQNTTYTSVGMSMVGNPYQAVGWLSPIGSNTTAASNGSQWQGMYTAATSAGPNSIGSNQINITSASNLHRAAFWFQMYNEIIN